jgi:GH35 family endo-1,4-beta-xylanase
MKTLHESVAHTAKEAVIKENEGFRVRIEKHEVVSPKGLFCIDLINETLDEKGIVKDSSTYNYFMTQDELQRLAFALTA